MFFNVYEHSRCFATEPDEAYFWHGQTTDDAGVVHGGQANAAEIAETNDGKTLEMCMLDNREELEAADVNFEDIYNEEGVFDHTNISYGDTDEENTQFWDDCSQSFADQASGEVHVIEGTDDRALDDGSKIPESEYQDSTYARVESPALEENDAVTGITSINANESRSMEEGEDTMGASGDGYDHIGGTSGETPQEFAGDYVDRQGIDADNDYDMFNGYW